MALRSAVLVTAQAADAAARSAREAERKKIEEEALAAEQNRLRSEALLRAEESRSRAQNCPDKCKHFSVESEEQRRQAGRLRAKVAKRVAAWEERILLLETSVNLLGIDMGSDSETDEICGQAARAGVA